MQLEIDQAEESALAFLVQSCISDGLLRRAGLTAGQAASMMPAVQSISDKLMAGGGGRNRP